MLTPFFNYYNTNHPEGPKKWYIGACPGDVVKVYLPAKGVLIRVRRDAGIEGHLYGEKVLINVQARFAVSPAVSVFYQHLTLRDDIYEMFQNSPNDQVIFDAGTHIGYVYRPPPESVYTLDFGVNDQDMDARISQNPDIGGNTSVNPLDYFIDDLREYILEGYQPLYDSLVEKGTFPYSEIEDSRQDINQQDSIWGVWYKDDLVDMWVGSGWSVVSLVKKADLHHATYWKTLGRFPKMSGLFVEDDEEQIIGKPLYEGQPIGVNRFYILVGNDVSGVALIEEDWGSNPPSVYLKYEVQPNTESKFDDKLIMESFPTQEAAEAGSFSDRAVEFRREPCRNPECP